MVSISVFCLVLSLSGYVKAQESNTSAVSGLEIGMDKEDVYKQLGSPKTKYTYSWGEVWSYGMINGVLFNQVIFDNDGKVNRLYGFDTAQRRSKTAKKVLINRVYPEAFQDKAKLFERAMQAVVTIRTDSGHGSGFVISEEGHLMTNAHCVKGKQSVRVIFSNGFVLGSGVIRVDQEYDLALLKIYGSGFKPLSLAALNSCVNHLRLTHPAPTIIMNLAEPFYLVKRTELTNALNKLKTRFLLLTLFTVTPSLFATALFVNVILPVL